MTVNRRQIERPPTSPAQIIREEILDAKGLTQQRLATALEVSLLTVNQLANGKRGVTPDLALRLAAFTRTSPELWLNLQRAVDLYKAQQKTGDTLERIRARADELA